ncbi:gastrin/cholecystokinin type B receptor isoform X1 [Nematostella vectensis]|uniref:gastrin/cholecystokinin type B receptor isoform X1 n=2 Tax=Nematostella vectensis TaxID=45351 RepID=UPI0020776D8F|nr:gastrin/cholecystokinin type B receptor isoform X1 [Nematostella vectensis]
MDANVTIIKNRLSTREGSDSLGISIRITIVIVLFIAAVLGNGIVLILLKRFKSLRTAPNILIANLAFVDLLNVTINLPTVLTMTNNPEKSVIKGRVVSVLVHSLQYAFVLLNLFDMTLMMLDRYFVIKLGLQYKVWSTTDNAFKAVLGIWLLTLFIMIPWSLALSKIDLGDEPALVYRLVYYSVIGDFNMVARMLFNVEFLIMAFVTWYSLRSQNKVYERNLSMGKDVQGKRQVNTRRRAEVHAAITVCMTVSAYVISCAPLFVLGIMYKGRAVDFLTNEYLRWFCAIGIYISSMCNPFIYMTRCHRFNLALRLFLKDPLGASEPGEKEAANKRKNVRVAPTSEATPNTVSTTVEEQTPSNGVQANLETMGEEISMNTGSRVAKEEAPERNYDWALASPRPDI